MHSSVGLWLCEEKELFSFEGYSTNLVFDLNALQSIKILGSQFEVSELKVFRIENFTRTG